MSLDDSREDVSAVAASTGEEEPEVGAARSQEVTNDSRELSVYKSSEGVVEASVSCVITDETTGKRFNYSMNYSSDVAVLYSAVAKEAG